MVKTAIILDLDDTIFETRSICPTVFEGFFSELTSKLKPLYDRTIIEKILQELWHTTWDKVIANYDIPKQIFLETLDVLENLELNLKISPYSDYAFIKNLGCPKFLVTTSVASLQRSKIKALKIDSDFTRIVIIDPFKDVKTKLDVFADLLHEYKLVPQRTYVIGDNSESEIMAGNSLNMITIQILRKGVVKGQNAKHYIKSFTELESII